MTPAIPALERIRFFSGELLTADDLTTVDENNRQLRWLHNRTLHNWGIAYGFNVSGARGDTSVTVSPGYANDSYGREIILSGPVTQPIPAVPGASGGGPAIYYLVANYIDDANEPAEEQRGPTACGPGGAVRLSNDPAIVWKTAAELNSGIDVVLGQISIQNCALSAAVSSAGRRMAATAARFSVIPGEVSAASLKWVSWKQGSVNVGFTAAVDTSAAKFQSTPTYLVEIVGGRTLDSPALVALDFASIANPSPSGFTLQVALPAGSGVINPSVLLDPSSGPGLIKQLGWRVFWLGVQG
jgi:hypothetical protein